MAPLSGATLGTVPDDVARPGYDRRQVTAGIVHLGLGGFAGAHLAAYVDRLLGQGGARDWGSAASAYCAATGGWAR